MLKSSLVNEYLEFRIFYAKVYDLLTNSSPPKFHGNYRWIILHIFS
ncbi:hypothetical protein BVAVS116_E0018 (plasmid) [Borreliella valaisiana VS116]|uniref:Uncharacterized protein n=1 Tax=Borreliella valaisiana VS116 TaxID=445987 RepID=C0R8P9_BORVA|nr:hypothetical protein BVAVS116_E0018 [Borreliella valaisiana VS116]